MSNTGRVMADDDMYIDFAIQSHNMNKLICRFFEKYQIPGVVGCVDGTHVALVRPSRDEEQFFNRKHYHSRNVQIVCTIFHLSINIFHEY
jgi:hypothetical protein